MKKDKRKLLNKQLTAHIIRSPSVYVFIKKKDLQIVYYSFLYLSIFILASELEYDSMS